MNKTNPRPFRTVWGDLLIPVAKAHRLYKAGFLRTDEDAVYADEGQYKAVLQNINGIDSGVVISASGSKHAPIIVKDLMEKGLDTYLIT